MTGKMRVGDTRVIAPNLTFASYQTVGGVKRFFLRAEEVHQTLVGGLTIRAWGYNGSTPGPVILVMEGERVQVVLQNRLPDDTAIHWHGLVVPNDMDGVPELGAGRVAKSGQSVTYDFVVQQSGTFMYHAHVMDAKQEMMGLGGMLIALPRHPEPVNRQYVLLLQEWAVNLGTMDSMGEMSGMSMASTMSGTQAPPHDLLPIDPMSMDFNYFTLNGKAFPDTSPLRVRMGERIRIRLGNLSMDSHPMHLHGHVFQVAAADGNPITLPVQKSTINVAPGETWDIDFVANNPGVWAFHCHKPHHMTNAHQSGMGGMFTAIQYSKSHRLESTASVNLRADRSFNKDQQ